MAERRKGRKKKDDDGKIDEYKPSKAEYAVSKYLRSKLPEKKTTLLSHKVSYFIASKAIDCLLESPWSTGKDKSTETLFTNREAVVRFMDTMLRHKFFHRAKKIVVQKEKKKKKEKEEEVVAAVAPAEETVKPPPSTAEPASTPKESKETKKSKKAGKETKIEEKSDKEKDKKDGEEGEKKKEKKKFKLDMHLEQLFLDGNEVYVWIYDPIPVRAWIIGTLMVVGAVLVCLFPLWPKSVRHYVYYLSVAAAGFLVFIIGLAVLRLVVFVLVWCVTFGKHHLWLLPNLTEDVGFFESFWPLYKYEFKGDEVDDNLPNSPSNDDENNDTSKEAGAGPHTPGGPEEDVNTINGTNQDASDHESEGSREGSAGSSKNGDNGFEILEAEDENFQDESQGLGHEKSS